MADALATLFHAFRLSATETRLGEGPQYTRLMAAVPGSVYVHAVYDGRSFVPSTPLDLPVGVILEGVVGSVDPQAEWQAFLDSVEGAWVGPDMEEPDDSPLEDEEPIF